MTRTLQRLSITAVVLACLALPAAAATSGYNETFDGQGNLAGWFANTFDSTVVNPGSGGNPDGHLLSRRSGAFAIGAATDVAAVTGDFTGNPWTIKADLRSDAGTTSSGAFRFRYKDETFNGWQHQVVGVLGPDWTNYSVTFDPAWTDVEAEANGWAKDLPGGFGSVSWTETMSDVFTTELRFEGTPTLLVGIDNVMLTAVPEPATICLLLTGLGLVGAMRRRKSSTAAA